MQAHQSSHSNHAYLPQPYLSFSHFLFYCCKSSSSWCSKEISLLFNSPKETDWLSDRKNGRLWTEKDSKPDSRWKAKLIKVGKHYYLLYLHTILRCTSHIRWNRQNKRCRPSHICRTGKRRLWPRLHRGTDAPSSCFPRHRSVSTRSMGPNFPRLQWSSKLGKGWYRKLESLYLKWNCKVQHHPLW